MKYCQFCGAEINDDSSFCSKCGHRVGTQNNSDTQVSDKNWLVTLLLCLVAGELGLHRFYVGRVGSGVAMILTLGGIGIWAFVDLIVVICGNFKDNNGRPVKNNY